MNKSTKWFVYILKCSNGCFYTGITNDVARRLKQHQTGKGAKYTRAFGAGKMVCIVGAGNRSLASKKEAKIKGWTRKEKIEFINKNKTRRIIPRRVPCAAA
jgi:putative endonuclease